MSTVSRRLVALSGLLAFGAEVLSAQSGSPPGPWSITAAGGFMFSNLGTSVAGVLRAGGFGDTEPRYCLPTYTGGQACYGGVSHPSSQGGALAEQITIRRRLGGRFDLRAFVGGSTLATTNGFRLSPDTSCTKNEAAFAGVCGDRVAITESVMTYGFMVGLTMPDLFPRKSVLPWVAAGPALYTLTLAPGLDPTMASVVGLGSTKGVGGVLAAGVDLPMDQRYTVDASLRYGRSSGMSIGPALVFRGDSAVSHPHGALLGPIARTSVSVAQSVLSLGLEITF